LGGVSIHLADYSPEWSRQFARESGRIRAALTNRALLIEHVGSTSVAGLAAKPIIDIVLVVASSADEATYRPALESAGYTLHLREPPWHEHRLFKSADPQVHLHVFSKGCSEVARMLLFRDWLREHADDRATYERAKRELAQREWHRGQDYADAKTPVVAEILRRAGWVPAS
jgi:GrpB-like predicted nucleotidyltransferase (UPF0157 family)